jgi:hypothetical protein
MTEDEFEPARRELCPDDACIGLIGPDGRCRVCGTVGASVVADPRHRGMSAPGGDGEDAPAADLDPERELCPDETCVGLIGPDGRCKECGAVRGQPPARAEDLLSESAIEVEGDDDRELCPNGSCIGLIGADGRCKVCGTARSSTSP